MGDKNAPAEPQLLEAIEGAIKVAITNYRIAALGTTEALRAAGVAGGGCRGGMYTC